jgi:cell division septation protein DedD
MFTFQLHRTGVVLVAVGAFLLAVLIFAGGYLAGMRHAPGLSASTKGMTVPALQKPTVARPAMPKPALPAVPNPAFPSLAQTLFGRPATTAAGTDPQAAPVPDVFVLRAGLVTSSEEANGLVQQLTARKLAATVSTSKTTAGPVLYSVHVGRYATRRDAAAALAALQRDLGIDGAIELLEPEPLTIPPPPLPTTTLDGESRPSP